MTSPPAQKWIERGAAAVVLAPMEGVTEAPMRALLTELGGYTHCVSEFVRVSQNVLPPKVFRAYVPELARGALTAAGVPVQVQLLGGDPDRMAESAAVAVACGAQAIDLNFGCPAPTVNRHDGGATLLRHPERLRAIVRAVRDAVPAALPVSAKLRLGWDDLETIHTTAQMAELGGASWLAIHARTRVQGYAPPAHWHKIGEVRQELGIAVIANGEMWSVEDFLRCRDVTGCEHFMLGRGAVADPLLARRVARELGLPVTPLPADYPTGTELPWLWLVERFAAHSQALERGPGYLLRRVKQWLRMRNERGPFALFERAKWATTWDEMLALIRAAEG